jgi:hypothetical protein
MLLVNGGPVKTIALSTLVIAAAALLVPAVADAQQGNTPQAVRQAEQQTESVVRRFGVGVEGGIGLDPEIIIFGGHATFGPFFDAATFRPGIEFGLGELTTTFGINLDVLYTLPGDGDARWRPYFGAGPSFALSHRGFSTDDGDLDIDIPGVDEDLIEDRSRFDFSDTDFEPGFNFIAGARARRMFVEMKATAWGVTNIRLLAGVQF